MVRWWMFVLVLALSTGLQAAQPAKQQADPLLNEIRQALDGRITDFFPGEPAKLTLDGNTLLLQDKVRPYQVYSIGKNGEISKEMYTAQGPAANGLLMQLVANPGSYQGAAVVPQELTRPYWRTYIQAYPLQERKDHLFLSLSYGSRTKPEVIAAIKACITDFTHPRTLPKAQLDARIALLTQADANFRAGLLELAKKYPALATTNAGPLDIVLKEPSRNGELTFLITNAPNSKLMVGGNALIPEAEQYSVLLVLKQHTPADDWLPKQAMGIFPLYPHLLLGGQINATAGDPKLQAALKDLVDRTLEPLKLYEAELAKAVKE